MKIRMKDSKTLQDSIAFLKQKIQDAEVDLTKPGVQSIANALLAKKDKIGETKGFAELRDVVKDILEKYDSPRSREYLIEVDKLNRLYQRDPRPGSRNDYWVWEKLLKYVWNIILKASGNPSPDVKQVKEEDSCIKDEEDEVLKLAKLLGEAHDKIIEANELAESLESEEKISSSLVYAIEDVEAPLSELDFMGENDPKAKLLEQFGSDADWDGEAEDFDL